jgi:hypothetical protein
MHLHEAEMICNGADLFITSLQTNGAGQLSGIAVQEIFIVSKFPWSISLFSLLIQLIHKGLLNSIESRFQDDSIALIIPPQVRSYEVKQEFDFVLRSPMFRK